MPEIGHSDPYASSTARLIMSWIKEDRLLTQEERKRLRLGIQIALFGAGRVANAEHAEAVRTLVETGDRLAKWLSAALDDPSVCAEMKADIRAWIAALAVLPREDDYP